MKHVKNVSKTPRHAADVGMDIIIQFLIAVMTALTPLVVTKNQPEQEEEPPAEE